MLSVVLPNFNHARFLPRALDAIQDQQFPSIEIIVVDDASTDDSLTILRRYEEADPAVRVIANPYNLGALGSLQRGLEQARGRYLYFAAADDQVLPGFFETAVDMLDANPESGLCCGETILVDGVSGKTIGYRPIVRPLRKSGCLSRHGVESLLRRADHFIHTGSSLFRRRAVLEKGGFDLEAGAFADGMLARKIALTHGLCFIAQAVSAWHIHADSLSRSTALEPDLAVASLERLPDLIAADPDFPDWYSETYARRWRFASARLILATASPDIDHLRAMIPETTIDKAVLKLFLPTIRFRPIRLVMLFWLVIRLRPFRLRDVALTALDRSMKRLAGKNKNSSAAPITGEPGTSEGKRSRR